jgi:hypothetical protein
MTLRDSTPARPARNKSRRYATAAAHRPEPLVPPRHRRPVASWYDQAMGCPGRKAHPFHICTQSLHFVVQSRPPNPRSKRHMMNFIRHSYMPCSRLSNSGFVNGQNPTTIPCSSTPPWTSPAPSQNWCWRTLCYVSNLSYSCDRASVQDSPGAIAPSSFSWPASRTLGKWR